MQTAETDCGILITSSYSQWLDIESQSIRVTYRLFHTVCAMPRRQEMIWSAACTTVEGEHNNCGQTLIRYAQGFGAYVGLSGNTLPFDMRSDSERYNESDAPRSLHPAVSLLGGFRRKI